ncbi:class II histone deacetylase [Sporosarcina sp. PTS2304]|uniref:class II histone deacetylase n=1 Tax=Sporosarcina sp. PTS2304 TaxID=2283194 RepID=UPI000E0DA822|nr:class II histone deacetylase [Sporosarcina sp. PTS2304]AXH98346.1 class II histone deacetylase [Sporosarcina sp. PTS2304]
MKTGFIFDESYLWHDNGSGTLYLPSGGYMQTDVFVEHPETKRRVNNLLARCGLMKKLNQIEPRPATKEEIEYFHTTDYIEKVKQLSDTTGGDAGDHAIVGRGSYEIALLSTGGALRAVDAVMEGEVDNVYAMTRPPGHHAERNKGIGFCIFNNVVIAAKYARKKYGLKRVLVLDWDVHHGNGTEQAFYDDPNVLFLSIHQHLSFPNNTGYKEDVGTGEGQGYNVNIPLPPGTGDAGYVHAFESIIEPIATEFKPELIIISAGQDPGMFDPLGRMMMTAEGFGQLTDIMLRIANAHCDGKIVFCHEGGYSNAYVPFCTLKIIERLSGIETDVTDPYAAGAQGYPDKLYTNQKEAVDEIIAVQQEYWHALRPTVESN